VKFRADDISASFQRLMVINGPRERRRPHERRLALRVQVATCKMSSAIYNSKSPATALADSS